MTARNGKSTLSTIEIEAVYQMQVEALNERGEAGRIAGRAITARVANTVRALLDRYPGREAEIQGALEGQAAELSRVRSRRKK